MNKQELDDVLKAHTAWLRGEPDGKRADLSGADLRGANLREANLREANLREANLDGAYLRGANLREANLREANLYGAILYGANLSEANLYGANLYGVNLDGVYLRGVNLDGVYLRGVIGNGREIKSLQCGTYLVTWTAEVLQIGCQRHAIADWWTFDDEGIEDMDGQKALDWWRVWKPILQTVIEAAK